MCANTHCLRLSIYVTLSSKQPLKVGIVALGQKIEATGDKEFWSNPTALDNTTLKKKKTEKLKSPPYFN